ncbi:SH3 domain-containing protein [Gymnodinialimonas sp. 57CJ19]|uniref:SH3 domain-containing protein n=1 Tax=Gymnodinialimonas sp. 57CJ19 TaxID=3138498 RepID=UPI00313428B8
MTTILLVLAALVSLAGVVYPFRPFQRRWVALVSFLVCFVVLGTIDPVPEGSVPPLPDENARPWAENGAEDRYWVISDRLNRRTCASQSCGIVGQLFFREGVVVREQNAGWARITQPYDAACVGGQSAYVDSGNGACDPANGISDGAFAEWVSLAHLSRTRPDDPAAGASGVEELIAGSDDFASHRAAFAAAAQSLIGQGRCTAQDFRDMGGWVASSSHRGQPIYFTYCGGATVANRLYLNAQTGEVFQ